jgi:hypothetical protein
MPRSRWRRSRSRRRSWEWRADLSGSCDRGVAARLPTDHGDASATGLAPRAARRPRRRGPWFHYKNVVAFGTVAAIVFVQVARGTEGSERIRRLALLAGPCRRLAHRLRSRDPDVVRLVASDEHDSSDPPHLRAQRGAGDRGGVLRRSARPLHERPRTAADSCGSIRSGASPDSGARSLPRSTIEWAPRSIARCRPSTSVVNSYAGAGS